MAASLSGPIRLDQSPMSVGVRHGQRHPSHAAGLLEWADWAAERLLFQVSAAFDAEPAETEPDFAARASSCPRLDAVRTFLGQRFAEEEHRMRETGYPDLAAHSAAHEAILVRLAMLESAVRHSHYDQLRFLDLLETWIVEHIERHDKPFGWHVAWHEAKPGERLLSGQGPVPEASLTAH